jgi:trehalose synthase
MRSFAEQAAYAKWVTHSHLDLTSAQDDVWMLLRDHVERYDAAILDAPHFGRGDISVPTYIVPPAIDPNSARNMELPGDVIHSVLVQYGIDPARPVICQVTPCDAACDLVGVYEAWEIVRETHPDVQLVIVLFTEPRDAPAQACYDELVRRAMPEGDAFIITPGNEIGNVEMNVFQTAASVVMQKGLRKGYGMWISDALWKRRPVIVGPEPGLEEQVIDGRTGVVAGTTAEFAKGITRLLDDRDTAVLYGENGRQHVADRFLITRYLRDYLDVLGDLHRKS